MTTTYNGSALRSASLELMTDGDQPSGQLFRVPHERLLDMCLYLEEAQQAADAAQTAARVGALTPHFVPLDYGNGFISADGEALCIHSPALASGDSPFLVLKNGIGSDDVRRVWGTGESDSVTGVSGLFNVSLLDIVRRGDEIVACGTTNFRAAYSENEGATWANSDPPGGDSPFRLAANATHVYAICSDNTDAVYRTTDLSASGWGTAVTVPSTPVLDDICATDSVVMVNDGNLVWASNSPAVVFKSSPAIPIGGAEYHLGAFGEEIYALRRDVANAYLYVTTNSTLGTWVQRHEFNDLGTSDGSVFRVCPQTGLMMLVVSVAASGDDPAHRKLFVSADNGASWSRPTILNTSPSLTAGYQCAAGRVIVAPASTQIYYSQRIL